MLLAIILAAQFQTGGWGTDPKHAVIFPSTGTAADDTHDLKRIGDTFSGWLHAQPKGFAEIACAQLQAAQPKENDPEFAELRARELEACKSIPVSEVQLYSARMDVLPPPPLDVPVADRERVWLSGILNTMLDEASTLTPEARRLEAEKIFALIPKLPSGPPRFMSALRTIALVPGDARSVHALLANTQNGTGTSQATPDGVRNWMISIYATKSRRSDDWKHGYRAVLAMTGDLAGARNVSHELAKSGAPLDRIYEAFLERAMGNEKPYDALMSACPDPDPAYAIAHGKPARRERYCEDVVADFARVIRATLGDKTPTAVTDMFMDTNRLDVITATTPTPAVVAGAIRNEGGDEFSAALQQARDAIRDLSTVERNAMFEHLTNDW